MALSVVIQHVATGITCTMTNFKLTEFQDDLSTKYNTEEVFGRMDPIVTYQGTARKISLGLLFDPLPAATSHETVHGYVTKLMRMQYPVYENVNSATTLRSPPLVYVKFANYIRNGDGGALLCAMNGFGYTPKVGYQALDSPYVHFGKDGLDISGKSDAQVEPTAITMKLDLTVLHDRSMGFENDCWQGGKEFGPHALNDNNPICASDTVNRFGLVSTQPAPASPSGQVDGPDAQRAAAQSSVLGT
jgi:hypothetical protein